MAVIHDVSLAHLGGNINFAGCERKNERKTSDTVPHCASAALSGHWRESQRSEKDIEMFFPPTKNFKNTYREGQLFCVSLDVVARENSKFEKEME